MLPQVVATPHIAASTREAQELVGIETRRQRPRLSCSDGIIRNAVNFPSVPPEECTRLRPYPRSSREQLGALVAQM